MAEDFYTDCNTSGLAPYEPTMNEPWDQRKAKHVFRRLGFGASKIRLDSALQMVPTQLVDLLLDQAIAAPLTETPDWGYMTLQQFDDFPTQNLEYINQWRIQSGNNFLAQDLKGRMISFWSNHFVAKLEDYGYAPYLFQYYRVLDNHAVGNFRDLVYDIGLTPAMLLFLNGYENTRIAPNENYARELFELFTLGEGNGYDQSDIVGASRALTGYNHRNSYGDQIYFDASTFHNGSKTIFGETGNWGYDDVIAILFQKKAPLIAQFICKKLYKYFVTPEISGYAQSHIIDPLVQTFINHNFELVPVLRQLFQSEHFFDTDAIGVSIKSPMDLILQFVNETGFLHNHVLMRSFIYWASLLGQKMFDPPDVSGWQGDKAWISTATLVGRWETLTTYLNLLYEDELVHFFVDLAKQLSNNSNDPEYITQVIIDFLLANSLHTESDYIIATDIFKWQIPQNHYDDGSWNLDWEEAPYQVYLLLKHISTVPEFQLK